VGHGGGQPAARVRLRLGVVAFDPEGKQHVGVVKGDAHALRDRLRSPESGPRVLIGDDQPGKFLQPALFHRGQHIRLLRLMVAHREIHDAVVHLVEIGLHALFEIAAQAVDGGKIIGLADHSGRGTAEKIPDVLRSERLGEKVEVDRFVPGKGGDAAGRRVLAFIARIGVGRLDRLETEPGEFRFAAIEVLDQQPHPDSGGRNEHVPVVTVPGERSDRSVVGDVLAQGAVFAVLDDHIELRCVVIAVDHRPVAGLESAHPVEEAQGLSPEFLHVQHGRREKAFAFEDFERTGFAAEVRGFDLDRNLLCIRKPG